MEWTGLAVQFLLTGAVLVALWLWTQQQHKARLRKWADERRFELLEIKPCFLLRGPFQWTSSRHQAVYRLAIRDAHGERFAGWACLGHFHWLLPNELRVEWDGLAKPRSY